MLSCTERQLGPFTVTAGVTRVVVLTRRWAIKVPQPDYLVRGWLANESEWQQRRRLDSEPPRGHFFHAVQWYRRAIRVGDWEPIEYEWSATDHGDELKGSSWGLFPEGWRLIDFDRAWHSSSRSLIGRVYYWNQERKARKWALLPSLGGGEILDEVADDPARAL